MHPANPRSTTGAAQLASSFRSLTRFPALNKLYPSQFAMSASHEHPYSGAAALEPYHDDPTMASAKFDEPRSPALHSPPIHHTQDSDAAAGPPLLTIRNSVPLIPTPGTISKRHPGYVRYFHVSFRLRYMSADLSILAAGANFIALLACSLSLYFHGRRWGWPRGCTGYIER